MGVKAERRRYQGREELMYQGREEKVSRQRRVKVSRRSSQWVSVKAVRRRYQGREELRYQGGAVSGCEGRAEESQSPGKEDGERFGVHGQRPSRPS